MGTLVEQGELGTWTVYFSSSRLVCSPGHVVHTLIHRVTTNTICTVTSATATATTTLTYLIILLTKLINLAYLYICIYMFNVVRACC